MKLTVKNITVLMIIGMMLIVVAPLNVNAVTQNVFKYKVSNGQVTIVSCDKTVKGKLTIPDTLGGYPVTSIGDAAFYLCSDLKSITIPNSVTRIGKEAFDSCFALKNIKIPHSMTSIGYGAFDSCRGLTNITIPNSVKSIGSSAFYNCEKLKSITIPDSVTSIGSSAFFKTAWHDNQPNGLIYAGKVAYYYKGDIPDNTLIVLKPGTIGIAGGAFTPEEYEADYSGLTGVSIPNTVTNIGEQAFFGHTGLEIVTIPKSVMSIGKQAFGYYVEGDYTTKFPGLTINCFTDSAGLKYAKENGFAYHIQQASATTSAVASTGNKLTVPVIVLTTVVLLSLTAISVLVNAKKKKGNHGDGSKI